MATNSVDIAGESSNLFLRLTNLTGANTLDFISGSFKGTGTERRIAVAFLGIGAKVLQVRFEFIDPAFIETDIKGNPLYTTQRSEATSGPV